MNKYERILIEKLMLDEITKENFLEKFTENIIENHFYIIDLLKNAKKNRISDDLEDVLLIIFKFNLYNYDFLDILIEILDEDWHYRHEDIVSILEEIGSNKCVNILYKTANKKYEYLSYNDSCSLMVKCAWALAKINTNDSIEKLRCLSESENKKIKRTTSQILKELQKDV